MRKRSAQAVSGRQNSTLTPTTMITMTPIAMKTLPRSPSAVAVAT